MRQIGACAALLMALANSLNADIRIGELIKPAMLLPAARETRDAFAVRPVTVPVPAALFARALPRFDKYVDDALAELACLLGVHPFSSSHLTPSKNSSS